jgi:hypothetical protein
MLIGDERVTPIIKDVWVQLPPPARIAAIKCEAKQVFRAQVLLLLDLLERETDERVYGFLGKRQSSEYSISNASCRSGNRWTSQSVSDGIRPGWSIVRSLRDGLDHLVDTEPGDPKVMPLGPVTLVSASP